MMKRLVLASALIAGTTVGAAALDVPKDVNGCLDQALALFKSASGANLASNKQSEVETLLGKMEGHCDAKQFSEAQSIAENVDGVIGK